MKKFILSMTMLVLVLCSENKYFKCSGDFCDGAVGLLGCF